MPGPLRKHRANVRIVLADKDSYMRQGLRNALAAEGYRDIRTIRRVSLLRGILAASQPDLLILDTDGDAIELVTAIRNNILGKNPFLPIILVISGSEAATVNYAANSGADLILMKPFSPAQLFRRIERLVAARMPFIVTPHYTGPDRRGLDRSGNVRRYDVPNTLKDKLEGQTVDPAALTDQIEKSVRQINSGRLEQMAITLAQHVEEACVASETNEEHDSVEEALSLVIRISERIRSSATDEITGLCASLTKVAETILADVNATNMKKELKLLRQLAQSAVLVANPDLDASAAIDDITRAIERYAPKRPDLAAHQQGAASRAVRARTMPEHSLA
jgi:DNA-binding response OmpR family regulator